MKMAVAKVNDQMGEAVGKLYVQRYFPPEAKQRMSEMVSNLMLTYEERIKVEGEWNNDLMKQVQPPGPILPGKSSAAAPVVQTR